MADLYKNPYPPNSQTTSGPFGNYQNPTTFLAQQNQSIQDPIARRKSDQYLRNLASAKNPYSLSITTPSPRDKSFGSYAGEMNPQWSRWLDQTAWAQEDAQAGQDPQASASPDYMTGYTMPTYTPYPYPSTHQTAPSSGSGGRFTAGGVGGGIGSVGTGPGQWQRTPIGSLNPAGELWDPRSQTVGRTGAQIGTNAGQALKALQEASGLNLLGSSSGSASGVGGAGEAGAAIPRVAPPDMSAARNAAFARAKDQTGQTSRAAIDALRGEMAGRGLLGSGIEGGRTAEIVGQAAGGLGEVSREQAIQDAVNASQWGAMQYGGDITQRGQDLSAQQQRAQLEQQRQQQAMQGLLQFLPPGLMY